MIGQIVSHYRITGELGAGGMGVVYRAEDLALGRTVAVKFLPEGVFHDPAAQARFRREARAASALNHPNICVIHELGEFENRPFIAMECLEGRTLADRLAAGRPRIDEVLDFGTQLADGLAAAHDKAVVHRDIKPTNIFITKRGDAKILDFGLATIHSDETVDPLTPTLIQHDLTLPGATLGTASYMSPEQALGKPLDHRTDLFSLGVVLYEMATGSRPFQGQTAAAVSNALLHSDPPAPDRMNPEVPADLSAIILRCLEKDPARRYPSAHDLGADLKSLRRYGVAPERPVGLESPGAAKSGRADRSRSPKRPASRRAVVLIPVLLVGAVGLFLLLRGIVGGGEDRVRTIAVLPFENQSPDEADAFFAAGVHEDVLTRLAGIKDLKVISRTSVLRYQSGGDVKAIGRRLGARYIVEGSVRRSGDQVRVTAQLLDAANDRSLWSDSYDRKLGNVFALQSELATAIAEKLRARITPKERSRLVSAPTSDTGTYDEYLRARAILNSSGVTFDKLTEAIERLRRATDKDPKFAEGWALLSEALSDRVAQLREFDDREADVERATREAEAALARAQSLDPEGPAAMRSEGYLEQVVHRDPVRALRSLDRALEMYPNDAAALFFQATLFMEMGQVDRAVANLERAYALDSANAVVTYALTFGYEISHRHADMVPFLERLLELEPEKTHYAVQAKYYAFLARGSLASFREFEHAVRTVPRTEKCDLRSVQNSEMVVAMANGEFDAYTKAWLGKWDRHYAGHGDWACPAIINDEANQARLLLEHGETEQASVILERARESTSRPFTEMSLCIFDRVAFEPKLDFMAGDSLAARREFEDAVPAILKNTAFPRGVVERAVLLETADMVAADRVYATYRQVVQDPVAIVSLESICANPWTYPNLLRDSNFVREVRADGRFVEFLEHYNVLPKAKLGGGRS